MEEPRWLSDRKSKKYIRAAYGEHIVKGTSYRSVVSNEKHEMAKLKRKIYSAYAWKIDFLVDFILFSDIVKTRIN